MIPTSVLLLSRLALWRLNSRLFASLAIAVLRRSLTKACGHSLVTMLLTWLRSLQVVLITCKSLMCWSSLRAKPLLKWSIAILFECVLIFHVFSAFEAMKRNMKSNMRVLFAFWCSVRFSDFDVSCFGFGIYSASLRSSACKIALTLSNSRDAAISPRNGSSAASISPSMR